jgi:hypothetical protein
MQFYFGASVLVSVAREHCGGWGLGGEMGWCVGGSDGGGGRSRATIFKHWQAPAAGALFCVMGAGNFRATVQTWLTKRKFAKAKKA